jgi:hypothetical protein
MRELAGLPHLASMWFLPDSGLLAQGKVASMSLSANLFSLHVVAAARLC